MSVNLAGDILDKYSQEEVVEYLDNVMFGILKNYKIAIDKGNSDILFACLGDLTQIRAILHEQRKRNAEKQALKNQ